MIFFNKGTCKYLITGLGNIGSEYANTRHNIGFMMLDRLAEEEKFVFADNRYGSVAEYKHRGCVFVLLKPSTYMNLSGLAVNYWLKKKKVEPDRLLVLVDDLALPFGTLRLKGKGSDGGHNGLKSINEVIGTQDYARLRFGVGNQFEQGRQMDFVLSEWTEEEATALPDRLKLTSDIIRSFATVGLARTMNLFNNK
ncbi:MAG: aminoacyl-tRNA hydrolase [Bacteroidales bacterium]|nr:aminoacyl-tRNA hydrolase [Bacteroidales bacterium]